MQLSHAEVGFRELLQGFIAVSARIARSAMLAISPVAITYMLVTRGNGVANNQLAPTTATAAITVSLLSPASKLGELSRIVGGGLWMITMIK